MKRIEQDLHTKFFDLKQSGHFTVLPVRPPRDPDPNERIQAMGAHVGERSETADWHEMDWYRRNVYQKKIKDVQ